MRSESKTFMFRRLVTLTKRGIVLLAAVIAACAGWECLREIPARRAINRISETRNDSARKFYNSANELGANSLIAHGGGIGEYTYTNSLDAVEDSLAKGFLYIELDLVETNDGRIIAAHDWGYFKELCKSTRADGSPMGLEESRKLKIGGKYRVMGDDDICRLMEANPQMVLVVDKLRNYRLLLEKIPYPDRMIVEVFSTSDYKQALEAGVKYPAYCIWSYLSLVEAQDMTFPIVTCRSALYEWPLGKALVSRLHAHGTTILLYRNGPVDCDATEFLKKHLGKDFSKVYTNTHAPRE